jgi:hypothetical protein
MRTSLLRNKREILPVSYPEKMINKGPDSIQSDHNYGYKFMVHLIKNLM